MGNPIDDPLSLLKALSPLLNPVGGVLGVVEMEKIVRLMKDAKQLVGRCVYLNILRVTEANDILEKILVEGGWKIMNDWLVDAKNSENMALILEVMKLLQRLPLRIDHLKQNNTPKLVKSFVKTASCSKVKSTASTLMTSWLTIIRDSSGAPSNDQMSKKKKVKSKPSLDKHKKDGKRSKVESKPPPVSRAPSFAKFRKTGLEAEPEPPKKVLKPDKKGIGMKRSSIDDEAAVPDKKVKTESKLQKKITISAGFMDALNSIPTVVKRPVKRKPLKPKPVASTSSIDKLSPGHEMSVSGEAGDFGEASEMRENSPSPVPSPVEPAKPKFNKYGKPMKTVRWVDDARIESIRYFEMEEGERVNVTTQNFKDALNRDRKMEREGMGGFHHKGDGDWKKPKRIDLPASLVEIGSNSIEKDIQREREKTVLQEIFLSLEMVPDSPAEPDPEPYDMVPPKIIPIEDPNDPGPASASRSPSPIEGNNIPLTNMISTVVGNGKQEPDLKDKLREILQNATAKTNSNNGNENQLKNQAPPLIASYPQPMMPNGDPNMMYSTRPPHMMPGPNGYFPPDPNMVMGPPPGVPPPNMVPQMMPPNDQYGMKWGAPPNSMGHNGPNVPPNMHPNGPPRFQPRFNDSWRPREPWRGNRGRPDFRGRWGGDRGRFRR